MNFLKSLFAFFATVITTGFSNVDSMAWRFIGFCLMVFLVVLSAALAINAIDVALDWVLSLFSGFSAIGDMFSSISISIGADPEPVQTVTSGAVPSGDVPPVGG